MASRAARWLIGCGLGCAGLTLIVVIVAGVGGASLLRNTTRGFDEAVRDREELQQRFGAPGEFVPAADGRIGPDRIEAFLAVREAMRPAREGIERFMGSLPLTREDAEALDAEPPLRKLSAVLGITRSAFGLASDLGEFFRVRNRALLDADMSLGEYGYVYVVVYAAWLGHPLSGDEEAGPGPGRPSFADREVQRRVHEDLRRMLRSQLAALPADADGGWRESLAGEVARLDADERALPWEDGLPEPLAASLEPYRGRLEAGFSAATAPFELGQARKRGRFSFDLE